MSDRNYVWCQKYQLCWWGLLQQICEFASRRTAAALWRAGSSAPCLGADQRGQHATVQCLSSTLVRTGRTNLHVPRATLEETKEHQSQHLLQWLMMDILTVGLCIALFTCFSLSCSKIPPFNVFSHCVRMCLGCRPTNCGLWCYCSRANAGCKRF